eukprot:2975144-Pyramimonas_sp.AAC.1
MDWCIRLRQPAARLAGMGRLEAPGRTVDRYRLKSQRQTPLPQGRRSMHRQVGLTSPVGQGHAGTGPPVG